MDVYSMAATNNKFVLAFRVFFNYRLHNTKSARQYLLNASADKSSRLLESIKQYYYVY